MIRQIYASDKRFKRITFDEGLNIILAERSPKSGKKGTRNGAGKTTLIHVIHFCLGSDLTRLSLPVEEISDWSFYIEIDICNELITAKRAIDDPNNIFIKGNHDKLPIKPQKDDDTEKYFYSNDIWKKLLGLCLFGINKQIGTKYNPSFRGLISYFIRRNIDAYNDPFSHFRNQKKYTIQILNSFLLGLNWTLASELQEIKEKETAVNALSRAIKAGIIATPGDLEAERVRFEKEIKKDSDAIANFKVHPQYKELHEKADQLTKSIHSLSNQLLIVRRKRERYEESVKTEKVTDHRSVESLYKEAGLLFPDTVKKTLVEAKEFHKSIILNRKNFLHAELTQINNQVDSIENEIKTLTDERSSLMQLLQTHGALEEFTLLQERLLEKRNKLDSIKGKISDIKKANLKKKEIKASKIELETKSQRDYEQSRPSWEKAIELFNDNSLTLYDEPGNLVINVNENGYHFDVHIQKSGSEGVGKMKIFCYDLALVDLWTQKRKIDFLIHDSTIFDGVDSRQRALALIGAKRKAEKSGFQYICALNSDNIPYDDLDEDFDINEHTRLKLSDKDPSESLFGFHFEINKDKDENNIETEN